MVHGSGISNTTYEVPVLVLEYFPNKNGVLKLTESSIAKNLTLCDSLEGMPLEQAKNKVERLNKQTFNSLIEGSKYKGYEDSEALPAINYYAYETKILEKEYPLTTKYDGLIVDYNTLLKGMDICDYVDNKGVKEVWIWGYCTQTGGWESNMAGPFGDISNSDRNANDMPVCKKTYTTYTYNYGRGLSESLENHGHQIEAVMRYADYTLWDKFVNPHGTSGINSCGTVHSPPNTKAEYDWANKKSVQSNCEDWNPEGTSSIKSISCQEWTQSEDCKDAGETYKVWWMQNIPGKGNNLTYKGCQLRNWWDYIGDFDEANKNKGLSIC